MEALERRDPSVGEGVTSVARGDRFPDVNVDRRWLGLLLVALLVLLGAGIAGLSAGQDEPGLPAPDVSLSVPTPTPTPTPTDDGPAGAGVPGGSVDSPTPDDGPATSTPDGDVQSVRDAAADDTATPTPAAGDGGAGDDGGGGGGGDDRGSTSGDGSDVHVQIAGSQARLTYADVVPGTEGREELSLQNVGNGTGRLLVTDLTVRDEEHGVGDPEAAVDDTPMEGELSENVLVVLEVHAPDGRIAYLFETESGPRSLASLSGADEPTDAGLVAPGEEATIVVDWYVPASTGNEIQGDEVRFDLAVGLRAEQD